MLCSCLRGMSCRAAMAREAAASLCPLDAGGIAAAAGVVDVQVVDLRVAVVVGLFVSFIQAITQINEASLAFLPKILAIGLALMMLGSFMSSTLMGFSHRVFDRIVAIGGS